MARRQLLALGLGEDAIDHRLSNGRLLRLERGVYAVGHAELRREGRMLAVVLAAGDGAVLSHRSAAGLWGLRPSGGSFVELTAPGRGGVARRRGRILHRSQDLPLAERTVERGVPAQPCRARSLTSPPSYQPITSGAPSSVPCRPTSST